MFSEPDMFDLCRKKADHGRLPRGVGFDLAEIPVELRQRLQEARVASSRRMSPKVISNRPLQAAADAAADEHPPVRWT